MARVLALVPDLLFGSRVQGALTAAGHDVELISEEGKLRDLLADPEVPEAAVIVVDLTDEDLGGAGILESLSQGGGLGASRTLAFYSHVDGPARERAERAGFDLVVPRSRMAREGPELVARLAGAGAPTSPE
jgi:hypothetical protein